MSASTHPRAASFVVGTVFVFGTAFFVLIGAARASTIDDINVVDWYGEGANRTALVIDFSTGNGASDSFAFGLNYDAAGGTISVYDVMYQLHTETDSTFDFFECYWNETLGYEILSMSYTISSELSYSEATDWPNLYLYLWTSGDAGDTWSYSWWGASNQTLEDGDIAGWVFAVPDTSGTWDTNPDFGSNYTEPVMPVPEPSTLVLLIVGILATLAWRRWRRG